MSRYTSPPDHVQVYQAVVFNDPQAIIYLLKYYNPLIRKKIKDYAAEWGLELNDADMEDLVQIIMIRFWKMMNVFK